ncbi:Low molecular weight protein tyrosine phosphatase [bacterium endosymbiont of Bathymodiolus sp. 5 South]|nr:Low molecular weight protein tyrosine phosphatase [bacterium endosymbiont of Bathymodiolus sp. 5 South]
MGKNWILLIIPIYAKVPKSLLNLSSLKGIVPKKTLIMVLPS